MKSFLLALTALIVLAGCTDESTAPKNIGYKIHYVSIDKIPMTDSNGIAWDTTENGTGTDPDLYYWIAESVGNDVLPGFSDRDVRENVKIPDGFPQQWQRYPREFETDLSKQMTLYLFDTEIELDAAMEPREYPPSRIGMIHFNGHLLANDNTYPATRTLKSVDGGSEITLTLEWTK